MNPISSRRARQPGRGVEPSRRIPRPSPPTLGARTDPQRNRPGEPARGRSSLAAWSAFETIADGVHLVRVPMPGGGLPYSLAYLIEDDRGRLHVIDPGSPTDQAAAALRDAVEALGRAPSDIAQIVLTHLHADHAGGAAALRASTGAPVLMHEAEAAAAAAIAEGLPSPDLEAWGVPSDRRAELRAAVSVPAAPSLPAPDGLLSDGDLLDVPGRSIRVVWTPGHTPGHLCLHDEDAGLLFTGDHVLPTINSGLGLGGPTASNPIADYLAGLRRVAATRWPGPPGSRAALHRSPRTLRRPRRAPPAASARGGRASRGHGVGCRAHSDLDRRLGWATRLHAALRALADRAAPRLRGPRRSRRDVTGSPPPG